MCYHMSDIVIQNMEEGRSRPVNTNGELSGVTFMPNSPSSSRSACSGCLRWFRSWIPVDYEKEIIELLKLAGPVFISQLMVCMIGFVSTVFCGHLGKVELAGVALATAVINVTGISIGSGLSSACDTLISQTFGSGNLKRVGVILQRGILILMLSCCPCWAVLINTESVMLVAKQEPEVARLAQLYVKIFMPALPAVFLYQLQSRYLQNQGIIWPQVICGVVGNILNALINYIFLYVLHLGVAGSAAANALSQLSLVLTLYTYIRWRGLHKATWAGWSTACLQEWGPFIRLAIPSMLMLCLEWWTYEIGQFLAGLISEVELGSQSVIYEICSLAYMLPAGFGVAANVRVGHALGSQDQETAKVASKLAMMCIAVIAVCMSVVGGASKEGIAYIFNNDQDIRRRVAEVMNVYAPYHLFEAAAAVSGGIIRGAGKQKIGAICNLVGYYFVGLPIGVSLMFAAKMGIMGLWIGLLFCVILQSTFFITFIAKLDWNKAVEEALVRSGVRAVGDSTHWTCTENGHQDSQYLPGIALPEDSGFADVHLDTMELQEVEPKVNVCTVGKELPLRTLIFRRGLVLCLMLLILIVGITTNSVLTTHPS